MKWVEMIRVRSSEPALRGAMEDLQAQLQTLVEATPTAEPFLLRHALYDGDLSVVLVWRTDAPPQKTREGLFVADNLQRLGSVDHAVWQPIPALEAQR